MCSIAANNCDMRQHSKWMTSSNTAASGLDLRYKDDSIFIHSIDSSQMVKHLCASQDYFQWYIFLPFTCNTRKKFGTKQIREWLDDNKWKIHFPNWDAYFFSESINEKSFTSICFGPIYTSLGRSQSYFY